VGAGGPDLLAVDHPVVAVAHRPRRGRRHVRPAAGLGEELAPDLLAAQGWAHEPLFGRVVGEGHDGRHAHAKTDLEIAAATGANLCLFLAENDRLDRRAAAAAPFFWPGDLGVAALRFLGLPGLGARHVIEIERALFADHRRGGGPFRRIGLQPGAGLGPVSGFFGAVGEVHVSYSL
jgi:hypothetical protein